MCTSCAVERAFDDGQCCSEHCDRRSAQLALTFAPAAAMIAAVAAAFIVTSSLRRRFTDGLCGQLQQQCCLTVFLSRHVVCSCRSGAHVSAVRAAGARQEKKIRWHFSFLLLSSSSSFLSSLSVKSLLSHEIPLSSAESPDVVQQERQRERGRQDKTCRERERQCKQSRKRRKEDAEDEKRGGEGEKSYERTGADECEERGAESKTEGDTQDYISGTE